MHRNLRRTLGVVGVPVLLGTAVTAVAISLPAKAQSWQDTALSATQVSDEAFDGGTLSAADGSGVINLSGTGVTWSLHGTAPTGVSLAGSTISADDATAGTADLVADATDGNGNAEALVIPVTIAADSVQLEASTATVALSDLDDTNSSSTVTFSAVSNQTGDSISFSESDLPSGLTSGSPTLTYVGGTAAPGTYNDVGVTATDTDGATLKGTFTLTVSANSATNYGDMVNTFNNGFDVYRQHDYAGAIIAGWPATQDDPATHFDLNSGSTSGADQFEYAPDGTGSGLCISDPGGGWHSDPLRDGLILAPCNSGRFQQFIPQSDGTLLNVATGLYVNPDGKGAQLRGESSPTSWGGSTYTWTDETSLSS
jgi:hypothetical protein